MAVQSLRHSRATFAYLHGSHATGTATAASDIDVAAYFAGTVPQSFEVLLPVGVDLLVLNGAPLELAGPVAARGVVLFDTDPVARVRWEATTRKIYFDELPRLQRTHTEFAESVLNRGG